VFYRLIKEHLMSSSPTKIQPACYLRLPQVLARFPVSKSHWWKGVKTGIYPKPFKLSENVTAWLCSDIDQLIQKISDEGTKQ